MLRREVTALLCKHLDCTYSIKPNSSISVDLFLWIQSPYFKLPCAPSCYSQPVFSQPSNNFLAEDKQLLVPHLNQQDTRYQLLYNGFLSFLLFLPSLPSIPSHSSEFFHRLYTDSTQENEAGGSTKNPRPAWATLGVPASLTYKLRLWFQEKKSPLADSKELRGQEEIIIIKVKGRRTHHLPAQL